MNGFYRWDNLPLDNWIKVLQKNDFSALHLQGKLTKDSEKAYELVYDEYLKSVGISKEYKKLLDLIKRRAILQFEYGITLNNIKLNKIFEAESKIENFINTGSENDTTIEDVLVYLSKWAGYRINPKEILAREYYAMLKIYQKELDKK